AETGKWQAARRGHRQSGARKSGPFSAKDSRARRVKESDAGNGRRHESIFRYGRATEECASDGTAADRNAENENRQSFRFAPGRKGTGARARRDREDAGRTEVLGFAGAIRHGDDLAGGKGHGRAGGLPD